MEKLEKKKDNKVRSLVLATFLMALALGGFVSAEVINTMNIEYVQDIMGDNIYYAVVDATTSNAAQAKNGSQYISNITQKLFILLGIIGGIIIAILWVKVAINFFSDDPQRKAMAKEDAIKALVGTILVAMAVFGAIWAIAGWMVGATQIILPNSLLVWAL